MSGRWSVWGNRESFITTWWAWPPNHRSDTWPCRCRQFHTQPEAFAYAHVMAQIDQAEAAQDAELDGFTADVAAWDEANVNDALRRRP